VQEAAMAAVDEAGGNSNGIETDIVLFAREKSARTAALDRMQVLWCQLKHTVVHTDTSDEARPRASTHWHIKFVSNGSTLTSWFVGATEYCN